MASAKASRNAHDLHGVRAILVSRSIHSRLEQMFGSLDGGGDVVMEKMMSLWEQQDMDHLIDIDPNAPLSLFNNTRVCSVVFEKGSLLTKIDFDHSGPTWSALIAFLASHMMIDDENGRYPFLDFPVSAKGASRGYRHMVSDLTNATGQNGFRAGGASIAPMASPMSSGVAQNWISVPSAYVSIKRPSASQAVRMIRSVMRTMSGGGKLRIGLEWLYKPGAAFPGRKGLLVI